MRGGVKADLRQWTVELLPEGARQAATLLRKLVAACDCLHVHLTRRGSTVKISRDTAGGRRPASHSPARLSRRLYLSDTRMLHLQSGSVRGLSKPKNPKP